MPSKTKTTTVVHERHEDGSFHARPDLSQCEFKTDKGRRCKLHVGHTGDHAMVLRGGIATPKTLAELRAADPTAFAGFTLTMEKVPTNEDVSRQYTPRAAEPRDADQKRTDADALKNYNAWVAKGSPAKSFEDLAKMGLLSRYIFPPAAFDTIVLMLRRATQSGGPVNGKKLSYRRGEHVSGNSMIRFVITDKTAGDSNGS